MANARDKFGAIAAYMEREHDTKTVTQYGKPTIVYHGEPILAYAYDSLGVKLHGRAMDHLLRLPDTRGWNPIATSSDTAPGWILVPVKHFYRWDKIAMDALHCMKQAQGGNVVRYAKASSANAPVLAADNQSAALAAFDAALATPSTSDAPAIKPSELPQELQSFSARDFEPPAVTPKSSSGSWSDRLKSALGKISEWKIG